MRVVRCVALMACCLALTGCSLFGRKSAPSGGAARPADPPARTDQPPVAARPLEPSGSGNNGLLAGEVIDGFNRRPSGAYIQVSLVREGNEPTAAPIEVAVDPQGYFTIQGLQVGRHYQLVARSQDSEHKLAGLTWATPPNPRLVIRLSEDNVNPSTPPVPAAPWPATRPTPPAPVWPDDKGESGAAAGWTPAGPAQLGAPVKTDEAAPAARERPARPDLVLTVNPQVPRLTPAPPPALESPVPPPPPPAPPAPAAPIPLVPAPVPSCVLTGQTLVNFALNDLNGRPWELRQHPSRLTLIDFWGTWCYPCRNAIPHLKILQDSYGNYGLTVVGIAYEKDGTVPEQVQKVNGIRLRYAINYQVLLGDMRSCPVRTQFDVRSFPTLVLIDESGRIVWRAQGLDQQHLTELEALIRQRLGVR